MKQQKSNFSVFGKEFEILNKILPLHTGIAQKDNAVQLRLLGEIHPMQIHRYPSGSEHNGWVVPDHYDVKKAKVSFNGKTIFDGTEHVLAVAGASRSFTGKLSKEELDRHIFTNPKLPESYLYNPMSMMRPWEKRWGLCVPYNQYKYWEDGDYEVELITEFEPNELLVGECLHQGETDETIVLNAHTCHPGQINDGLSGSMLILKIFEWLKDKKTRYTYRGILAPEHIGTIFYLSNRSAQEIENLKLGIFLESVGSDTPLALQQTFYGNSIIDEVTEYVLQDFQSNLKVGAFRTIVGNDETVWEAAGIEVPMVSISRHPFPYYHSSEDNLQNQSVKKLIETFEAMKQIIEIFEKDRTIRRKFTGLIALSNPKYDLYRTRINSVLDHKLSDEDLRWGTLQDYLPRYFDDSYSIFGIAKSARVKFNELISYLENFESKGLVDLNTIETIDSYIRFRKPAPLIDLHKG